MSQSLDCGRRKALCELNASQIADFVLDPADNADVRQAAILSVNA